MRSLAIHPATTTHSQLTEAEQATTGVTPDLVRLCIGLETLVGHPRRSGGGLPGRQGRVKLNQTMTYAPVTGAWRPGDDPGRRSFVSLFGSGSRRGGLELEAGGQLRQVTVAYETWGELDARASNAVLVLHALSGDSHVSGPAGPGHPTPGWWGPLDRARGADRHRPVLRRLPERARRLPGDDRAELVGAEDGRPYGSRFPVVTVRDQVAVERALAFELGIDTWSAVVGGSMGGMRALSGP